jgi:cell volume regulation protein A
VTDPVTVFLLVVAGLLVVGTLGERIFARTGVPAVIWLIALGLLVRVVGIVPAAVITGLAPFFAALALVIILFDAGTHLSGAGETAPTSTEDRRRAQLLGFAGFAATAIVVALFSQALHGLNILETWGWAHAFMLGSLLACGASEVFLPSLAAAGVRAEIAALLRRESAITKALAVVGTVVCLDLLSPRVATGGAGLAMLAGFGFALAFGSVAGVAWIVALQRLAGDPRASLPEDRRHDRDARNYGFSLAVMLVLYVLTEAAGGAGALAVLIFGVTLGNADGLLRMLRRGPADESDGAAEVVHAALSGHARTISFIRTLVFAMVGLCLAPPWGPLVMGVVLGVLLLVCRLAVARFTLTGLEHAERSIIAASAPRGMATVALATLPLAHAVPGAAAMLTLVFAAVTTSIVLFTVGLRQLQASAARLMSLPTSASPVQPAGPTLGSLVAAEVAARHVVPVMPEIPAPAAPPHLSATEIRAPTLRAMGDGLELRAAEPKAARPQSTPSQQAEGMMHTLPQIDLSAGPMASGEEDPLATAMARALSRRPEEVTQTRRRPTSEEDSFASFTGPPGADEAAALLADLNPEPPLQLGDEPDQPAKP